jgi:hypothetical protein
MAINPNLETISSGYNISKINSNFQAIGTALQDAVSRSGQAPNQMDADFDMNGNDILNVDNIDVNTLTIDGVPVIVNGGVSVDPDSLVPVGGTDGQILTKQSSADYDIAWEDPAVSIPTGGVLGQYLAKQSSTDFDADWESLPFFNVKDYGATGDGVTNDTAAILAAETARAAVGGALVFPPGTYLTDGTSINRANGGMWRGEGQAQLIASANSTIICNLSGAVMTSSAKKFRITNLDFSGNGFTSVRAVNENGPHWTILDNLVIRQVQFAGAFVGANVVTQHGWIQIHDIIQYGAGSWAFYGYDNSKYLFHIEINNIHQLGTGASNWESQFWFEGRRAVGLSMNNVWSGSLDGDADGLLLRGDCQGVFVTNSTFVWPIVGIRALTWTDSLKPAYVYMSNVGVDQHTESGGDIEGRTWFLTNCNFANGYVRTPELVLLSKRLRPTSPFLTRCLLTIREPVSLSKLERPRSASMAALWRTTIRSLELSMIWIYQLVVLRM